MKIGLLFATVLALNLLIACGHIRDAYFVNPCDETVTIVTYLGDSPNPPPRRAEFVRFQVDALSMVKQPDAFTERTGDLSLVRVLPSNFIFEVNASDLDDANVEKSTVVIPAEACS